MLTQLNLDRWELFLTRLRFKEARVIECRIGEPLLLDDPEKVWVVYSGTLNIFYAEVENDQIVGGRTHYFKAVLGQILMGVASQTCPYVFFATGSVGAQLLEISREALIRLRSDPDFTEVVEHLLGRWISDLADGLNIQLPPREYQPLKVRRQLTLDPGRHLRVQQGMVWIKQMSGRSQYVGKVFFDTPEYFLPLTPSTWLTTVERSEFVVVDTKTVLDRDEEWKFLPAYYDYILSIILFNEQLEDHHERVRLEVKSAGDMLKVQKSLTRLVGTLVDTSAMLPHLPTSNALLEAATLVGETLGIKIEAPVAEGVVSTKIDPLKNIARASRIRVRRVALETGWWEKDNGPLLGYLEPEKDVRYPVALLPTSDRTYKMINPADGKETFVTEQVAETLAKFGYTFYRPFPNRPLSGLDLARFGLQYSRRDLFQVIMAGIMIGLLGTATPLITGYIFDNTIPQGNQTQLLQIALVLMASAITMFAFQLVQSIAVLRIEGRTDGAVQSAIWDRLLELPTNFFRDYSSGDLALRGMGISTIRKILSGTATLSILSGIFSLFNLALLFYYSITLALVAMVMVVIAMLVALAIGLAQVRQLRIVTERQGKISGHVLQFINGIAKFRVAGAEARVFSFWADKFTDMRGKTYEARKTEVLLLTFNAAYPIMTSMVIFSLIAYTDVVNLSLGDFVAFNAAFNQFLMAGLQLTAAIITVLAIVPTFERSKPIIEAVPEVDENKVHPGELTGRIAVDDVSFRYRHDTPLILKNVSFEINRGEFVALVGASGSGKSTLLRMMLGFEKPETGAILYDGQDLEELDIREVRQQIGVVLQNSQLMSGSDIFTNIVGATTLTIDDAWRAAEMVGLKQDIKAMPMGIHTVVSEGGSTLSGGQRQRILIARAIVTTPRILFFDEATSALDNETQAVVSQSLEKLDATRIVIAHRLSTIINADRILVMDKGAIVQSGTYKELVNKRGVFAELAKRQLA